MKIVLDTENPDPRAVEEVKRWLNRHELITSTLVNVYSSGGTHHLAWRYDDGRAQTLCNRVPTHQWTPQRLPKHENKTGCLGCRDCRREARRNNLPEVVE